MTLMLINGHLKLATLSLPVILLVTIQHPPGLWAELWSAKVLYHTPFVSQIIEWFGATLIIFVKALRLKLTQVSLPWMTYIQNFRVQLLQPQRAQPQFLCHHCLVDLREGANPQIDWFRLKEGGVWYP